MPALALILMFIAFMGGHFFLGILLLLILVAMDP